LPVWEIPDFETIKKSVLESGISEEEFLRLCEEERKKMPFLRDNTIAWMVAYNLGVADKIDVPAMGPRIKGEPVKKTIGELTTNDSYVEVEGYIFGFRHVEKGEKSFYAATIYDSTGKISVRFYRDDVNFTDGEKVLIRGANVFSPTNGVIMLTVWEDADVAVLPGNWEEIVSDKLEDGKLVRFIGVCVGERKMPYTACSKCGKKVDGTPGSIGKCSICGTVPIVERVWTNLALKGDQDVLVRMPPDIYYNETFVGKILQVLGEYEETTEMINAYKVEIYHVPTLPQSQPVQQPVQPTQTVQPQPAPAPTQSAVQPAPQPQPQPQPQVQPQPHQPASTATGNVEVTEEMLNKVDEIARTYGEYPGETIAKKILMGKFRDANEATLNFLVKYWEDKFKEV